MTKVGADYYRLRVYLGTDPMTGKPRTKEKRFHGGERAASRELARMVTEAAEGRFSPSTATVAQLLERWVEVITPKRSPTTMREHRRKIKRDIVPALGSKKLTELTAHDIDRWTSAEAVAGKAPATIIRGFAILSAALNQGEKWGWITVNPIRRADKPSLGQPREFPVPSPEELNGFYLAALNKGSAIGNAMACAIGIAAFFGNRRGEVNSMRWSDFDFEMAELKTYRSRSIVDGEIYEKGTKTSQGRTLAADEMAAEMLRRRMAWQRDYAETIGVELVDDPYFVTVRADGSVPLNPDTITHEWAEIRGDRPYRYQDLRHFVGTYLIKIGTDPKTVQKRLGHASMRTTDRYVHAVSGTDRDAAEALGALIGLPELEAAEDAGA